MAKVSDIANIISGMRAVYPNYNPPDPQKTASMLMQLLGDLPAEALQAAVLSLCADSRQFAPSAGEIRQTALRLNAKAAGIPDAWQAFEEVCKMPADMIGRKFIQQDGQNVILEKSLEFSHPLVESVARTMGWPERFPTDMPAADRSQFIKAYESALSRALDDAGRLEVVAEYIDNRRQMGCDALALVGNLTKKLEVNHAGN